MNACIMQWQVHSSPWEKCKAKTLPSILFLWSQRSGNPWLCPLCRHLVKKQFHKMKTWCYISQTQPFISKDNSSCTKVSSFHWKLKRFLLLGNSCNVINLFWYWRSLFTGRFRFVVIFLKCLECSFHNVLVPHFLHN